MNWYLGVLKLYANFNGIARRQEYWMFVLFNIAFALLAMAIDNIIGSTLNADPYGVVYCIYATAIILPSLAVTVRRLHDIGKSGTWIFIFLVPIIGSFWILTLLITDSQMGTNEYGDITKGMKL